MFFASKFPPADGSPFKSSKASQEAQRDATEAPSEVLNKGFTIVEMKFRDRLSQDSMEGLKPFVRGNNDDKKHESDEGGDGDEGDEGDESDDGRDSQVELLRGSSLT